MPIFTRRRVLIGAGVLVALAMGYGGCLALKHFKNSDSEKVSVDSTDVDDSDEDNSASARSQSGLERFIHDDNTQERDVSVRVRYDIKCFDQNGIQLPMQKSWTDSSRFDYLPVPINPNSEYSCRGALPESNSRGSDGYVLSDVKMYHCPRIPVDAKAGRKCPSVDGGSFDNNTFTFSVDDPGAYFVRLGFGSPEVGKKKDKKATDTKSRSIIFTVGDVPGVSTDNTGSAGYTPRYDLP